MRVTVYTKEDCQPCRLTKKKFNDLGIPFVETSAVDAVDHIRGLGYVSAPVIEVDCGEGATVHWSGFRPDLISELRATLG